jgi:hypothetical protein
MENTLNQENDLYQDLKENMAKTTKIGAVAYDSSEKFKKFVTLGVTGAFGTALLSVLPHSPLDNFVPVFAAAMAIPAYYGVKALVTHHMADNAEKNLVDSQKQVSIKIAEMRDKFNNSETLNVSPAAMK